MASQFVQIAPDSTGKKVQTFENTVSGQVVEAQAVSQVDSAGLTLSANTGSAAPVSALQVGGSDGVNLRTLSTDSTGRVNVNSNSSAVASATGGSTLYKFRNLAATVQAVKASAGTLYSIQIINSSGATAYVQLFNVSTGGVTLGTTTPDLEFLVTTGTEFVYHLNNIGVAFTTAISVASTTTEGGATGSAAGVMLFAQFA